MKPILMLVLALATAFPVAAGARRPFVVAQYSPGLSDKCGWMVQIYDDGTLTRFTEPALASGKCDTFAWPRSDLRKQGRRSRLTADQVGNLKRAISEFGLASLPFHGTPGIDCDGNPRIVSDQETLTIQLTEGASTKTSGVYGWRYVLDSVDSRCPNAIADEVRRFLSVWVVVLDVAGTPNPGDNREQFKAILRGTQ